MKVQNITDVEGFFKVVDSCKGRVELVNFHKECKMKGRDSDLCIKSEPSLFLVKI